MPPADPANIELNHPLIQRVVREAVQLIVVAPLRVLPCAPSVKPMANVLNWKTSVTSQSVHLQAVAQSEGERRLRGHGIKGLKKLLSVGARVLVLPISSNSFNARDQFL